MAKIKLSAIGITNISGKSGGSVFAHNKNGNYVRRLGVATQPQTTKQTLVRNLFGVISRMWGELTEAEREAWKSWGTAYPKTDQFGDSRPLTGRQAFISVNSNLQSVGLSYLTVPRSARVTFPTIIAISANIIFTSAGVMSDAEISADMTNGDADIRCIVSVAVVSKGADFGTAKNKYVQIATSAGNSLDGFNISQELLPLGVNPNNNVYLKVEFVSPSGQKTSPVTVLMSQSVAP